MRETAIARRLGIPRYEVKRILRIALAKLAHALNAGNAEPVVVIGPHLRPERGGLTVHIRKRCSHCGRRGHQRNTCRRKAAA